MAHDLLSFAERFVAVEFIILGVGMSLLRQSHVRPETLRGALPELHVEALDTRAMISRRRRTVFDTDVAAGSR